jgi:hypothetical protein
MAEATAMRNNALPYPIYGAPFTIVFPWRDADGDLIDTSAGTPDSEISKNGDTFADCTNEATQIATTSGVFYLTLTGTELTTDVATVQAKSGTAGAKTPVAVLMPRKLVTVHSGTSTSLGSLTTNILLDSGASAVDDYYNGMVVIATIDSNIEVRVISDYTGSSKTATVTPDWNVAPDNTDTFIIKLPEGARMGLADVTAWTGTTVATVHTAGYPVVTIKDGTGTGEIDTTSGGVLVAAIAANAITASAIATDAIGALELADGAITAATFAAGAIDATAIANGAIDAATFAAGAIDATAIANGAIDAATFAAGAIDAAALAADAGTEIGTAVWATASRTVTGLTAAALADFFDTDSATTYASAVAGSVVKEIADNAGGASLTVQDIVDGVWDEDATAHQDQGSFGQTIGDSAADAGTIYAAVVTNAAGATIAADIIDIEGKVDDLESRLGTPTDLGSGATVSANLVDIESQTDDIGVAGAGLTNINLPNQTMDIIGSITGNLSGSVGSVTGAVGSVTGAVGSVAAGGIAAASFAANAIDSGALATTAVAEIADGVWDEVTSGHVTAGTFGQTLYMIRGNTAADGDTTEIELDASASAVNDFYNNAVVILTGGTGIGQARTITDYVGATKVATVSPAWDTVPDATSVFMIIPMFPAVAGGTAPTAAEIADAVWDEDATGHQTGGTFGQAIGDPGADANTIFAAVVTGAAGATIAADIVDIEGKVDDLESRLGTPSDLGSGATVAANLVDIEGQTDDIASVKTKTDSLTFTVAGVADANIQYVNDVQVTGTGVGGDEWGP